MAANLFAAECSYALVFERSGNRWKKAARQSHEKAILHLASAAATMGFVLAPMMPEQPAPEKKPETGTLAELNVKPGDVVAYVGYKSSEERDWLYPMPGRRVKVDESGYLYGVPPGAFHKLTQPWRIVSRAGNACGTLPQPVGCRADAPPPRGSWQYGAAGRHAVSHAGQHFVVVFHSRSLGPEIRADSSGARIVCHVGQSQCQPGVHL